MDLSELSGKVVKFEELIASAMRERLTSSYPIEIVESMLEIWGSRHLNLSTFLDTYVESKVFPLDRLERVMDYLFDVELETYFIFDVDFGGYNRLTHQGFNSSDPANTPPPLALKIVFGTIIDWEIEDTLGEIYEPHIIPGDRR